MIAHHINTTIKLIIDLHCQNRIPLSKDADKKSRQGDWVLLSSKKRRLFILRSTVEKGIIIY